MGNDKKNLAVDKMFIISKRMQSKAANKVDIKERVVTFYTKILSKILKQYKRKRYVASILIFIESIQIISLLYHENVIKSMRDNIEQQTQYVIPSDRVNKIYEWFNYFRIYPLLLEVVDKNDSNRIEKIYFYFSLICASLNLALLGYLFLRLVFWIFIEYSDSLNGQGNNILNGSNYSTVNTMIEQRQNSSWKLLDIIVSPILQCYSFIFAIPFSDFSIRTLYSSLTTSEPLQINNTTKAFGSITLITTLTIQIIMLINDIDFSILERDSLSQKNNMYKWLSFVLSIVFSGIRYGNIGGVALSWIGQIFSFFRLVVYYKDFPYSFSFAQNAVMLQNSIIFINNLICVTSISIKNSEYSFLFFLTLPLGYKLNTILMRLKENELLPYMSSQIKNSDISLASRYIRYLIDLSSLSYEKYLSSDQGLGVIFETLFTNHIFNCSDETCFCIKYFRNNTTDTSNMQYRNNSFQKKNYSTNNNSNFFNGLSIIEMHGFEYRRSFIIDYLNSLFGKLFNFGGNSVFQFNYNMYEQENSLNENHRSNINVKASGRSKQKSVGSTTGGNKKLNKEYLDSNIIQMKAIYVYYLMQVAQTPAKAFTQIFELRELMIKDKMSLQSKYIVQCLIYDTFDSFYHFFCMPEYQNQRLALTQLLEFDYLIKDLKRSMLEGLQKKQNYFEYLYSDSINLLELVRQSEICILQKEIIEQQLIRLFDISPLHPMTFILADIYIEYFDFKKRRIRNFVTRSRKVMNNLLRKNDRRVDLFPLKSCALFISFRNNLIFKTTYTAANMFSCQITDLINKPLNLLIPQFLVKHTNKYLQSLNEDGDMLWIQLGEYFTFIKNSKGYTLPVYIRSKLDIVDGNDFGLTLYIQPANKKKEYIICDFDFQYLDSTKNITKILTKSIKRENKSYQTLNENNNSSQAQLKKLIQHVNIRNIIPFLLSQDQFEEINNLKDYNESLGFQDQQARHINVFTSVLAIPVNSKQISLFGQKVRLDAYEIDKYFCTYPSDKLQFLEISFSVLRQKSYYEPEKYLHYIEIGQIRRFRKQAEINEYISLLNEKLTKLYQSPIQIPLLIHSTFYYRPPRPPTVMLQQQLQQEEDNQQQANLESISEYNSPKKSSPTHYSEAIFDQTHNFEEYFDNIQILQKASSKILTNKGENGQNLNKVKGNSRSQHFSFAQVDQNQVNYSSPRAAQGGLNLDNMSILDSPTISKQYQQRLLQNNQVPTSNNYLYFSPRSDNKIYHGNSYSETNIQNSVREISMHDNQGKEEEYLSQLLSQTQLNYQELFSPISPRNLQQNQTFQGQENDDKTAQNSNTNNLKNFDSFSMTNSLLSPELRRPKGGLPLLNNISHNHSNVEESYNQFVNQINNQHSKQSPYVLPDNGLQQRRLIKIQAAPISKVQQSRANVKRSTKKKFTNVNVEYDEEEEEEDEMKQGNKDKNNVISLKDIGSVDDAKRDQFAFHNNNSDDSDDIKKKQRDIVRDDSSVRSGESQFFSKKVNIFDIIINKREPSQMIYIKFTGFISFMVLMVLTFILFLQLKYNLDVVWNNFNTLEIGPSIIEQYAQVLRNKELIFSGFSYDCESILKKNGSVIYPLNLAYRKALYDEGLKRYSMFFDNIDKVQRDLFSQSELQDYFFKNTTTLLILKWIIEGKNEFLLHETTRGQALIFLPYYLKFYYKPTILYLNLNKFGCMAGLAEMQRDIYPQAFTYQNYNSYVSSLFQISQTSQEIANEKLQQTKQLLIFSVILVELISSIIVLVIFPVYYKIQGRKEEILKLICTFNSDFISNQVTRYKDAQHNRILMQDESEKLLGLRKSPSKISGFSTNKISMKFIPNQNDRKKRTISTTNNLNRFSLKLSFRTFCIFLLLSLSPVLNLFLMRGFFENFKYNIEEHSMIYLTKSYLSLNYLATYLLMNFPAYRFGDENRNKLLNFITELRLDNQNRLQTFYELDKNFQVERYDIDEYKSIFLKTLKEDGCQILLDNQNKTFTFHPLVQPQNCSQIFQGKINKGLILALKEQYDKLVVMQELYKNSYKNSSIFAYAYFNWVYQNNIQDQDTSYYYTRDVIDLLSNFIWQKSKDYFDYLIRIQLILFIEGLIVISVVFLIIGTRFIKSLGSILYNTTFLFTLIPIDSLIENPYIFNYLNSENRRNKGK